MQISSAISQKQIQIAELTYQLNSSSKQNEIYKKQSKEFEEAEFKLKDEMKTLQNLVEDKTYQLKFFQEKLIKFKDELQLSEREMERLSIANMKLEVDHKEMQDKYMSKMEEIISVK